MHCHRIQALRNRQRGAGCETGGEFYMKTEGDKHSKIKKSLLMELLKVISALLQGVSRAVRWKEDFVVE